MSAALDDVIASYLRARDGGAAPSRDELLAAHPDLAQELAEFLDDELEMDELVRPFGGIESAVWIDGTLDSAPTRVLTGGERVRYFGDYELVAEIARGGMGVVHRARQVSLNRPVALKMILAGRLASEEEVRRFRREAEAAAALDHPGIVPIYEIGVHEGQHYFSMQLVEGESLADALPRLVGDTRRAAQILQSVAEAVAFGHRRGILHRDLKPGNILLDADGRPHVTDFGLAKRMDADGVGLTATGALVGTPTHMAPEQTTAGEVTTATDVWGLGVVLYQLLCGEVPFRATTPFETLRSVREDEPAPPTRSRPDVPRDLETICLKCLEKDPALRYADASTLAADLGRYLRGEPIEARPAGSLERGLKWARRRPAAAALIAVSALAVLAGAVAGVAFIGYQADVVEQERGLRRQALAERAEAERNRRLAELSSQAAEARAREARELAYASGMALAFQAWERGDTESVEVGLDALRPAQGELDLRGTEWGLLRAIRSDARVILPGGGFVVGAGGRLLTQAVGSDDVELRDAASGERVALLEGFGEAHYKPYKVCVSADGSTVAIAMPPSVNDRGTMRSLPVMRVSVLSVPDGALHSTFDVPIDQPRRWSVTFVLSSDGSRLAAYDGKAGLTVWSTDDGQELGTVRAQRRNVVHGRSMRYGDGTIEFVTMVRPSPSAASVATIVRERDGALQQTPLEWAPDTAVLTVAWSPDGARVAIGGEDGLVAAFDTQTGAVLHARRAHTGVVLALAFSSDGDRLASGGLDRVIRIADAASGLEVGKLRGARADIGGLHFVSEGSIAAVTHDDLLLWDLDRPETRLAGPGGHFDRARITFDGNQAALLVQESYAAPFRHHVLEAATSAEAVVAPPIGVSEVDESRYADTSADGSLVALSASGGVLELWRPGAAQADATLDVGTQQPGRVAVSADGSRIALADLGRGIQIWDPLARERVAVVDHARLGFVHAFVFSPDNRWLACAGQVEEELVIVDARTGEIAHVLARTDDYAYRHAVAFSPDGSRLAALPRDGGIEIYATSSWQRTARSGRRSTGLRRLAFSPDGRTIAAGSEDGTVALLHATTGLEMAVLRAHAQRVTDVAFSPDGRRLLVAGTRHVRVWEVATE